MRWIRIDTGNNVRLYNLATVQSIKHAGLTGQLDIAFVGAPDNLVVQDPTRKLLGWIIQALGPDVLNIESNP